MNRPDVRAGHRRGSPRPGIRVARALGAAVCLTILFAWLASQLRLPGLGPYAIHAAMLAAALASLRWERRAPSSVGLAAGRGFWLDAAGGLAWGGLSIVVVVAGMVGLTGEMTLHPAGGFLGELPFWVVVGVAEETMFRGYILATLREGRGPAASAAISSALFTLVHLLNPEFYWFAYLYAFLTGLLLAGLALRRGNLGCAIGFHIAWNLLQGRGVFDVPARGGEILFGAVLSINFVVLWLLPPRRAGSGYTGAGAPAADPDPSQRSGGAGGEDGGMSGDSRC